MSKYNYPLVEDAAGSYSGISKIIRDENNVVELLHQIDNCYNEAKSDQQKVEKELEYIKMQRGNAVTLFIYCLKALEISGKPLVFQNSNHITVIKQIDENTIDYEKYELTDLK
ncbi:hypothetical protein D0T84_16345 [Dysgonomonas sp. 521]|uniref:hypothetical protein n=1 Tax=Dysgonomonas sp. 521 TaxID=2302932 RepID=UPI0013D8A954|nr:hypothetical protein [Dysgonomonas sp. 521]NDV96472.1 hypothetical protein [Dysgonomonas sp. 521]